MKFKETLNILFGLPKSLLFNIKIFGIRKGLKIPILLGRYCKYKGVTKGCIDVNNNYKFGHIKIGVNYGPFGKGIKDNTFITLGKKAKVIFLGNCNISSGSVVNVSAGECVFGNRFAANAGFLVSCEKEIIFGDDILFGWACTVIDGDGHFIIDPKSGAVLNKAKSIKVNNHVWIAAESTILKGTTIPANCVIGYGSLVSGKFNQSGCIIGGMPAKVIAENRDWIR